MAINATSRKPLKGNDRSHALNTHKRSRKLNLQYLQSEISIVIVYLVLLSARMPEPAPTT